MAAYWRAAAALLLAATIVVQVLATSIAVHGVFMTPIGWCWALLVWANALAWFLVNDRVKLLAYRMDLRSARGLRSCTRAWPKSPARGN